MDTEQRIAQFLHMTQADPDNDMAHFSLGNTYLQAQRHAEAAASFLACVKANPAMSKARQLAGESLIAAGEPDRATQVLTEGYTEAATRGDLLPRDAIAEMLDKLGKPVPELTDTEQEAAQAASAATPGGFTCTRTSQAGTQLPRPPFRGPVGAWIHTNISAETWRTWIGQGTKVINELRLDLSREEDQKTYDQHMHEFLGVDEAAIQDE